MKHRLPKDYRPLILFQSFLDKETPSIPKFISGWDTWYIWGRGVFRGVEAFEVSIQFEMSTQVFRDRWNVEASDIARNTHNPIRSIVESLVVEPNPAKSLISLSIGEIFLFYACVCARESFILFFLARKLKNRYKNTSVRDSRHDAYFLQLEQLGLSTKVFA